jgi:prevent-host-death family protein
MDTPEKPTTVGAFEAKTHLSALLDRAEKGETITITKHGRPVARLVPVLAPGARLYRTGSAPRVYSPEEQEAAMRRYREYLSTITHPMTREEIVALVREGRD